MFGLKLMEVFVNLLPWPLAAVVFASLTVICAASAAILYHWEKGRC